jgi:hypothetical protein
MIDRAYRILLLDWYDSKNTGAWSIRGFVVSRLGPMVLRGDWDESLNESYFAHLQVQVNGLDCKREFLVLG